MSDEQLVKVPCCYSGAGGGFMKLIGLEKVNGSDEDERMSGMFIYCVARRMLHFAHVP